ncbi:GNAT family N-acetyltransferase [Amnibacterium kyonggiense]
MTVVVRPLESADAPAVLAMDNAAVPAVTPLDRKALGELVALASLAVVAEVEPGAPAGFLIAMDPGVDYGSENYRWFQARSDSFVYVDRIVVADGHRGTGVGRALYDAAFARAREFGRSEVTCEVNVRPANPESLAFHARLGFERLEEQETKGGAYRVALLSARLPGAR